MLVAGALVQRPGKIAADTKVALAINPAHFLGNVLHLWDPSTDLGSVGNQSVGYLAPMGPFFLVTHALGIPVAVAQRLWLALLLIVAFWGAVRVMDALGSGGRIGRIVAGLAYALSPFMLSRAGDSSAVLLGSVMLPWALLPLIRITGKAGSTDADLTASSVRRAAARSGCAVLLMGAANATVTLCALIGPVLWLALMCRGKWAWALRAWWAAFVACAICWWAIPLALQSRYGIDFIPYTESAKTTTSVTSLPETLRGTADWLDYFRLPGEQLAAAWTLITRTPGMVASYVVVGLGLAGLSRRSVPARRFLLVTLSVGVVGIAAAYPGYAHGVLADGYRHALTGPLSAFRNVNKFQPLVRLPLCIGLACCLQLGGQRAKASPRLSRFLRRAGVVITLSIACAAVILGAQPLAQSRIYNQGTFASVPSYWPQATAWLAHTGGQSRTLLLPASGFGDYRWGDPVDEPMLWLAHNDWAVRNIIPLGGINSTRLLDAIELQLEQAAAPGLAQTLARAGIGYVLVRNDLGNQPADQPPSTDQVANALSHSGLHLVASFGPKVPVRESTTEQVFREPSSSPRRPALEIYATAGANQVDSYPASELTLLSGGPEAIPLLAATNQLGNRPTILAADVAAGKVRLTPETPLTSWVDTDTLQRRDEQFGTIHGGSSYLLAAGSLPPGKATLQQRFDVDAAGHQTVMTLTGISGVTASAYGTILGAVAAAGPQAAVDGNVNTAWSVAGFQNRGQGQWLQITFPKNVQLGDTLVTSMLANTARITKPSYIAKLRVTTDTGTIVDAISKSEKSQHIRIPAGRTRTLRLTIESVSGRGDLLHGVGIRELSIPGIAIGQSVTLPSDDAGLSAASASRVTYLFQRDRTDPRDFNDADGEAQLARTFVVPRSTNFVVSATAVGRAGGASLPGTGTASSLPCGSGPDVVIDSKRYQTYVQANRRAFTAGQPVPMEICTFDAVHLSAGEHTLRTEPSTAAVQRSDIAVATVSLRSVSSQTPTAPARKATRLGWGDEHRQVAMSAGPASILTVHENFNKSWQARMGGKKLAAIRIDGWQQGFVVPAGGAGVVTLTNQPGVEYRWSLAVSGLLVLVLILAAVWPARRQRRRVAPAADHGRLVSNLAALGWAMATTALVAGWLVMAVVPLLALVVWGLRKFAPALALAAIAVAAGMAIAQPARFSSSHEGAFSELAQIAVALGLAVTILAAGAMRTDETKAVKPLSAETSAPEDPCEVNSG